MDGFEDSVRPVPGRPVWMSDNPFPMITYVDLFKRIIVGGGGIRFS